MAMPVLFVVGALPLYPQIPRICAFLAWNSSSVRIRGLLLGGRLLLLGRTLLLLAMGDGAGRPGDNCRRRS